MSSIMIHVGAVGHGDGSMSVFWSTNHEDRDTDYLLCLDAWEGKGPAPVSKADVIVPEEWTPEQIHEYITSRIDLAATIVRRRRMAERFAGALLFGLRTDEDGTLIARAIPATEGEASVSASDVGKVLFALVDMAETQAAERYEREALEGFNGEGCGDPHCPFCNGQTKASVH